MIKIGQMKNVRLKRVKRRSVKAPRWNVLRNITDCCETSIWTNQNMLLKLKSLKRHS